MSISLETTQNISFNAPIQGRYALHVSIGINKGCHATIQIDDIAFREIPECKYKQRFTIPASWNGNILNGQTQTNIFVLDLLKGNHNLKLITKGQLDSFAWQVVKLDNPYQMAFDLNMQANDLERQPLVNFITINLPLMQIIASATVKWHYRTPLRGDGDDIKVKIDGKIATNDPQIDWLWQANNEFKNLNLIETKYLCPAFESPDIHYVEFIADRSPILRNVSLNVKPVFKGDYWCQPELRQVKNESGQTIFKPLLGVYHPNDNPERINNQNVTLFFRDKELPVGPHLSVPQWKTMFDFEIINDVDDQKHWYYYGIDSSWKVFNEWLESMKLNIFDWMNASNWKLLNK